MLHAMAFQRLEPWSYPIPHYEEHAQVWHARRYASWLLRAGAEARFGILLHSGAQALARWMILLEEQGVEVVRVTSKLERPLPQALTDHQGDHFNRRLFVVDGLNEISLSTDEQTIKNFWETLEGQRSQLKQLATWVTLHVTHPKTLYFASLYAPKLMNQVEQVSWMWVSQEASGEMDYLALPNVKHHNLYDLFCSACASTQNVPFLTLGRIFRCGYMKPPKRASEQWKWGYRLWRGEVRDPRAARFGQVGVTETLPTEITPDGALWAFKGRGEAATPARKTQWFERALTSLNAWQISEQVKLPLNHLPSECKPHYEPLVALHQWACGSYSEELVVTSAALKALEPDLSLLGGELLPLRIATTEWLTKAYAQQEDLEGCIRVNETLSQDTLVWPEARFVAYERLLDLALFQRDFTQAKQEILALESLVSVLHSPIFECRYLEAKAKQLGALDQSRGENCQKDAEKLAQRFGMIKPVS